MKTRILVMNGSRIVQTDHATKGWQNQKVEKAGAIPPGIYNVYLAGKADKSKIYDGPIVHADDSFLYQMVDRSFVKHERPAFAKIPEIGSDLRVQYEGNSANIAPAPAKSQRRGIAR